MAIDNIEIQLSRALESYSLEVQRAAEAAAKEAAEVTARTLQQTSPKKAKKGGKYARGWTVKKQPVGTLVSYIVYNGKFPGLTHLLEHGHIVSNQHGTGLGRARAIKHIAPAADAGIQRFELGVRARLRKDG